MVSVGGRFFTIAPLEGFAVDEVTPTAGTMTSLAFTVPVVGGSVSITVDNASAIPVGYPVLINGKQYLVTARAGNVITASNTDDTPANIVPIGATVTYLEPNAPDEPHAWFEQAKQWLIGQNNLDAPVLFDGATMRRAKYTDPARPEVPVGSVMAYINNRLWVATKGNEIAAGDIANGPTDVIVFSEELAVGGGRFIIGGKVTAMVKSVTLDTSLGQGPLQIFTRTSAHSINVPTTRSLWPSLNYPVQTVSLTHAGALSQYSTIQVNSDIFFRGKDGLRSFAMARREGSEWGSVPISSELNRVLDDDEESLLEYGSAILFDNRLIFTVSPRRGDNGVYHRGVCALDFDPISRMGIKGRPAYDGVWTGINPTLLLHGEFDGTDRAFAFVLNSDSENELWEIDPRQQEDEAGPIKSVLEFRSMDFRTPLDRKKLWGAEMWVDEVRGQVDYTLKWGTDQSSCDNVWGDVKSICSKAKDCDQNVDECKTIQNYEPGYRTRIGFGQPPDTACEGMTNAPARMGYEFQPRLEWIGHCRMRKMIFKALEEQEEADAPCD